jgi:hypothetical protein
MSDTSDWNINVNNGIFITNMAEGLYKKYGDGAYVVAIEKVMKAQEQKDDLLEKIYKEVLQELDNLNESEV